MPNDGAGENPTGENEEGAGEAEGEGETPPRATGSKGNEDALKRANAEAAARRKEVKDLTAKLKEYEDANATEAEKLTRERDELASKLAVTESRALRADARSEALEIASSLKFKEPALAFRLLDFDKVSYDDDGSVMGVKEQLTEALKEFPSLAATTASGGDGGAGGGKPDRATSMNDFIRGSRQ